MIAHNTPFNNRVDYDYAVYVSVRVASAYVRAACRCGARIRLNKKRGNARVSVLTAESRVIWAVIGE